MNTIKNLTAFILGIIALFLFYYYVSIPIIPCLSVYITALLFIQSQEKGEKLRKITTIVVAVFGGLLYGINAYMMIKTYPQNGNVLGIIFEILTAIAFIATGMQFYIAFTIRL